MVYGTVWYGMGRANQVSAYPNDELRRRIINAADDRDQSVSEFLIEAARRELQRTEVEA